MNALILIDLINDMVSPDGKLAAKGYGSFAAENRVPASVANRRADPDIDLVVHVGLEFRPDYPEAAARSLLLGKAPEFGVAQQGEQGAEFAAWAKPDASDVIIRKRRMSPFFGTDLELLLRSRQIDHVVLGGVATDLAVSSAARDAHDRDFTVTIAKDCCVASNSEDHEMAIAHLVKFAYLSP